jgi:hypothetical protein
MSLTVEQKALRKGRVGASEIGALIDYFAPTDGLRVDPHKTAFDVFAERDCPSDEAKDHQTWGLFQEPAILGFYAQKLGLALLPSPGTLLHPKIGALCATPDGLARSRPGACATSKRRTPSITRRGGGAKSAPTICPSCM